MRPEHETRIRNRETEMLRSPTSTPFRVPSLLRCSLLILAVKFWLKVRGFMSTIDWIRRRVETIRPTAAVLPADVRATEYAVAMAGALYPGRALCLEQSLVLYYELRRQGLEVKLCQGVQPHPFLAHAWVECCGEPVNDVLEHVKRFTRLPDPVS
jgi:hypothetical protein